MGIIRTKEKVPIRRIEKVVVIDIFYRYFSKQAQGRTPHNNHILQ
jgi:hypothetical protein